MSFENVKSLYDTTKTEVDETIESMFQMLEFVMNEFHPVIFSVAVIYVALMGYGIISGHIVLSGKDAATRFSKVILILFIVSLFSSFSGNLYKAVWQVPESIGDFLAATLEFGYRAGESEFKEFMDLHSEIATQIGQKYSQEHKSQKGLAIGVWAISMAPVFVINISIILARVISAVLFFISPVVFILSLMGIQNNYLAAWFKAILLTFLTVIIVFIVGTFVLDIVHGQLVALHKLPYEPKSPVSLIDFAPLGVLSVFGVVIISQATTIASSIIGAAPINTQQATGFLQIAALQGASKLSKPPG